MKKLLNQAIKYGVPKDQIENFLIAGYVPQPKQLEFHAACRLCDKDNGPSKIGFGGARGPGKTHALFAQLALDDCQRLPGLRALLLRKVGKSVRETFNNMRQSVLGRTYHEYNKSEGVIKFPNDSRIVFGHFKDESDIDAYLGLEYDVIGIEEATTLSHSKYLAIKTINRTSKLDWRPRIYTTTNPGGVGHAWYKKLFVIPWRNHSQTDTLFIPATVSDNKFLNKEYRKTLEELQGWRKRAWRYGDWDISAGQYFSNYSYDKHVVESFPIPSHWEKIWVGLDYGWTHPTAAVVLAQNHEGITFVVNEYAKSRESPDTHIQNIRHLVQDYKLYGMYAGGDMWQPGSDGTVVADKYIQAFPFLEQADMNRIAGATTILQLLGERKLRFFDTCERTYQQISNMQHDPNRPEDVLKVDVDDAGEGGDDLYDALRYALQSVQHDQEVIMTTISY
jgi:PBSX family phage terminase large subunit